jgi:hypothetical protein
VILTIRDAENMSKGNTIRNNEVAHNEGEAVTGRSIHLPVCNEEDDVNTSFEYKLYTSTNVEENNGNYESYQIEVMINKNGNKKRQQKQKHIDKEERNNIEITKERQNKLSHRTSECNKDKDTGNTNNNVQKDITQNNVEEIIESSVVRTTTTNTQPTNKQFDTDRCSIVQNGSKSSSFECTDSTESSDDNDDVVVINTSGMTTKTTTKTIQSANVVTIVPLATAMKTRTMIQSLPTKQVSTPLPQRNLCLPDVDDMSMNYVFTYVKIYHQDKVWSYISDSLFVIGSIAYLVLSIWDWLAIDKDTVNVHEGIWYRILDIVAPFIYVSNSIIDTQWALSAIRKESVKRNMQKGWNEWRTFINDENDNNNDDIGCNMSLCCCIGRGVEGETSSSSQGDNEQHQEHQRRCTIRGWWNNFTIQSFCQSIRKHVAHRRSLLAAITFGIAATCELVVRFISSQSTIKYCELISTHTYIVSAIISVTGRRVRPWLTPTNTYLLCDPERLEDLGDILFLIGCIIDGIIDDLYTNEQNNAPIISIITSILWLIDSFFYFCADFVRTDQEHGNDVSNNDANYLI